MSRTEDFNTTWKYIGVSYEELQEEVGRLTAALNEIIEWSEEYKHDDGTYETDRGDPGNIARAALV